MSSQLRHLFVNDPTHQGQGYARMVSAAFAKHINKELGRAWHLKE
jgi:hypothetical protein